MRLYTREQVQQAAYNTDMGGAAGVDRYRTQTGNGVSYLQETAELIAEDDMFWTDYTEPIPQTAEEQRAEEELQAHREDVMERNMQHSLRALIWWLSEGGVIPDDWEVPSKVALNRLGARALERMLDGINRGAKPVDNPWEHDDDGDSRPSVFVEGWADYVKDHFKLVVFSKVGSHESLMDVMLILQQTYCPYSRKAKSILSKYSLSPSPYIIELDIRCEWLTWRKAASTDSL